MLMGTDFDINFLERFPHSVKYVLKQTMITQEVMFRNQVNELHRLYTAQKSLMKDNGCQKFGQYNSGGLGPQSTLIPVVNSTFLQESSYTGSCFQQRPLELQSPAGEYINYIGGETLKKRNEVKEHFFCDSAYCSEEVKLSLSIGDSSRSENIANKSWNKKVIFSQDIIDLEESTKTTSNEDPKSISINTEESAETKKMVKLFDLNKSQFDDSFFQSTNPLEDNLSLGSSTGDLSVLFESAHGSSCSTHTSLEEPKNINASRDILANIACSIDLESVSSFQLDLSDGPHSDCKNFDSSQLTKTPSQDDFMGSSEESEIHNSCFDQKKKEATLLEMDYTTQKAALSLLSISLVETSTNNQDCIFKSCSSNHIEDKVTKVKVKPLCSLDSYESLVLKIKESNEEDECVSSKPFDQDQTYKKECGFKLRRGRRLNDFQKDILPSLSTLSQHEIWEDIKIIQGVIRSREYKKLRAQAANSDYWFTPVRSKRSRLGYVGRKRYS